MFLLLLQLLFVAALESDGANVWSPARPPPAKPKRPAESGEIAAGAKGAPKLRINFQRQI